MAAEREVADLYASQEWPAVVTSKDRRRRAIGRIVNVTDEALTVDQGRGSKATFRHDEVLEIFPAEVAAELHERKRNHDR